MSTEPVYLSIPNEGDTLQTKALVVLDRGFSANHHDYQPGTNLLSEAVERTAKKYQTVYLLTMRHGETAYPAGWLRYLMKTTPLDILLLPDRDKLDCQYVEDISEVLVGLIYEESRGGNILSVLTTEIDSELVFRLESTLRAKFELRRKNNGRV